MQTVDSGHAAAIAAGARVPVASVFADWAGTGVLTQAFGYLHLDATAVEVNRSYATALPEGVGFIDGHAAAELRVEVAGATADAMNRFNTLSPLYSRPRLNAPITASIGMAGHTPVLQFTGLVRTIASDSRSGVAKLEALDYAEKFRFAATVPDVVGAQTATPSYHVEQTQWLNASWLISEVLSQGGVHISPPQIASTRLYASLHGSLAPRPSYGLAHFLPDVPPGGVPPFIAGRSGLALFNTPAGQETVYEVTGLNYSNTGRVQVEFWALTPYTGGTGSFIIQVSMTSTLATYIRATINATTGQMSVVIKRFGQVESAAVLGPTPSGAATWRYYAFHVAFGTSTTTATVTIRTDNVQTVGVATVGTAAAPAGGTMDLPFVWIGNDVHPAIESLQVMNIAAADFSHSTHTPQASVDASKLWLDRTPTNLPDTAWELLTEIAAAEYATIELSEGGMLLYRNADRWAAVTTPVATITATADMLDLAAVEDVDTVRNQITVPIFNVERRRKGDRQAAVGVPVAPTQILVPANETKTIPVIVGSSVLDPRFLEGWIIFEAKWTTGSPYYSSTSAALGTANTGQWNIDRTEWTGPTVYVTLTNTTAGGLYMGAGSTLDIVLTPPNDYKATDAASTTSYGPRSYTLPASQWRQQGAGAQEIANRVLADLKNPVTLLDQVPVVGDPRRQLGDRITVKDPTGLGVNQDYWVIGIRSSFKPGSLLQTLTLRPCTT